MNVNGVCDAIMCDMTALICVTTLSRVTWLICVTTLSRVTWLYLSYHLMQLSVTMRAVFAIQLRETWLQLQWCDTWKSRLVWHDCMHQVTREGVSRTVCMRHELSHMTASRDYMQSCHAWKNSLWMQSNVACSSWRSSCLIFTVCDTFSPMTSCVWLCHMGNSSLWKEFKKKFVFVTASKAVETLSHVFLLYSCFQTGRHRILILFLTTINLVPSVITMRTTLLPGTNRKFHMQNSVPLKSLTKNLKILCHRICNQLYRVAKTHRIL